MEALRSIFTAITRVSSSSGKVAQIEDSIFMLHYKLTSSCLLFLSIITFTKGLFDSIKCYSASLQLPKDLIDTFCWMQNSFVLPQHVKGAVGEDLAYQGVDHTLPGDTKAYVSYYRWIPFLLMVQGVFFYLPHYLWTRVENGNWNLVFESFFAEYEKRTDAMVSVFPRVAKCIFRQYGVAGDVQTHDILCALPFNVLNEKIFLVLVVWMGLLSLLTALELAYWLLLAAVKWTKFRVWVMRGAVFGCVSEKNNRVRLERLLGNFNYNMNDWFRLWLLMKNMDDTHFESLLNLLLPKVQLVGDAMSKAVADQQPETQPIETEVVNFIDETS